MRSVIRFNGHAYGVSEVINTGMTAIVYKTTAGSIIKQYRPRKSVRQLEREVYWLNRLKGTGIAPDLFDVDRSARAILMSDCGEPISASNAPDDWEKQLKGLMNNLRANECTHNDLSEHEVLVKDGKLRIVDFAFAFQRTSDDITPIDDLSTKTRYFLDDHFVNFVRFHLSGPPLGSEPHCFVLWKAEGHGRIQGEISQRFEILRAIVYTPNFIARAGGDRKALFRKFYCGGPGSHGEKGLTPFILYFVMDKAPRYEIRTNPFRGTQETVNVNVFDLKNKLRGDLSSFLHGSDSVQECFDNLEALTIHLQEVPKSYWLRWRPRFSSVSDFFARLNETVGLEYVVLRNFEDLMRNKVDNGADIDLLVNDFYLLKRVSGAIGYKHKRWNRPGPALEYGGYKIAGYVSIGGQEVSVDIRFVGDGYYCEQWEREILSQRVRTGNFFIPNEENLFYSLLYHALVHKRSVSDRYRRALGDMMPRVGLRGEIADSDERLWKCLDDFMRQKRYVYIRPDEVSIPLSASARGRMGITIEGELRAAMNFMRVGRPYEAINLLQGVLLDDSRNREARRMLAAAQRNVNGTKRLGVRKLVRIAERTRLSQILPEVVKGPIKKLVMVWE